MNRYLAVPRRVFAVVVALTAFVAVGVFAVGATPQLSVWGSGTVTEAELHGLVSQMTLDEEIGMVHGSSDTTCAATLPLGCVGQAGWIPGVARLGIPPLRMTDGPAGVRLGHVETAMPAPVGLAATFDRAAAELYGSTVGDAGRATDQDVWLAPMINQVNYSPAGRNFETLGEDPYLAGELVAPEVQGVQGEGMIAELKHYIENDFENGRNSTSVKIGEQTLHETELQAFEAGHRCGRGLGDVLVQPRSTTSTAAATRDTLQNMLQGELGFTGFVTSDWGAAHRTTDLIHGNDIEQPGSAPATSRRRR